MYPWCTWNAGMLLIPVSRYLSDSDVYTLYYGKHLCLCFYLCSQFVVSFNGKPHYLASVCIYLPAFFFSLHLFIHQFNVFLNHSIVISLIIILQLAAFMLGLFRSPILLALLLHSKTCFLRKLLLLLLLSSSLILLLAGSLVSVPDY